ncbi:MAG: hypothetical protein AAGK01_07930 [Pseudomonadota bacterium]
MLEVLALATQEPAAAPFEWQQFETAIAACAYWVDNADQEFETSQAFVDATGLTASGLTVSSADEVSWSRTGGKGRPLHFQVAGNVDITTWDASSSCDIFLEFDRTRPDASLGARRENLARILQSNGWNFSERFGGHRLYEWLNYEKTIDSHGLFASFRNYYSGARITAFIKKQTED